MKTEQSMTVAILMNKNGAVVSAWTSESDAQKTADHFNSSPDSVSPYYVETWSVCRLVSLAP